MPRQKSFMAHPLYEGVPPGTVRTTRDGERVFDAGSAATHAYFLQTGAVEVRHEEPGGLGVVVKVLAAPNLFGVIEQLGAEPFYLESVRSLGDARMVGIARDRFLQALQASPPWCFAVLQNTGTAFCMAARFEPGQLATPEAKLANYVLALLEVASRDGARVELKRSQADFAEAIGASERSVSRILTRWQEEGVLDKQRGRYELQRRDVLVSIAGPLAGSLVFRGDAERKRGKESA